MMTAYQEATSLSPCKGILVVDGLNVIHEWTKHLPPGSPHLSKIIMTVFELFGDIQKNQLGQPMASVVVDRRDPIITDLEIMQWQRHGFQIVDSKSMSVPNRDGSFHHKSQTDQQIQRLWYEGILKEMPDVACLVTGDKDFALALEEGEEDSTAKILIFADNRLPRKKTIAVDRRNFLSRLSPTQTINILAPRVTWELAVASRWFLGQKHAQEPNRATIENANLFLELIQEILKGIADYATVLYVTSKIAQAINLNPKDYNPYSIFITSLEVLDAIGVISLETRFDEKTNKPVRVVRPKNTTLRI